MATDQQRSTWKRAQGSGINNELGVILEILESSGITASTFDRFGGLIGRFAGRLSATRRSSLTDATSGDCEGFVWARTKRQANPSIHTVHLRRSAIRFLFAVLHDLDESFVDPSGSLALPSKRIRRARPLTTPEITVLRISALGRQGGSERSCRALALAEATATTGEIPRVRWKDVDLFAGTVSLPGASPVRPRSVPLSSWGRGVLTQQFDDAEPDDLVIAGRLPWSSDHSGQSAMANLLSRLLEGARLCSDDIRPSSIRLWAGAEVLSTDGIEAAARVLGLSSLDATRSALHHPTPEPGEPR